MDNNCIMFYARDPGGANVLLAMCKSFGKKYKVLVFAKDFAVSIFQQGGLECIDINSTLGIIDESSVENLLRETQPRLVITGTSTEDRSEYIFWRTCHRVNIKVFAVVDSWSLYIERFSSIPISAQFNGEVGEIHFPDRILAIDEEARIGMIQAGIPKGIITVCGYWHFHYVKEELEKKIQDDGILLYRKRVVGDRQNKLILFLSEGLSDLFGEGTTDGFGYNEKTIFRHLRNALSKVAPNGGYNVVVRLHPKESDNWWKEIKNEAQFPLLIDNDEELSTQICAADLIVGMQTQCLNEAALIEKNILSIQIGLNRANPLFTSRHNIIHTALDVFSLERIIRSFFENKMRKSVFEPDGYIFDQFKLFIKEELSNAKACN